MKAKIQIISEHSEPRFKEVTRETREELEEVASNVAKTINDYGFLDDEEPDVWYYIPRNAIKLVRIEFIDD